MKRRGRSSTPLTDKQLDAINDYLTSNKSIIETAAEHGTTRNALMYWITKYRKEHEND